MLVRYRREQEADVIATLSLDLQPQATEYCLIVHTISAIEMSERTRGRRYRNSEP